MERVHVFWQVHELTRANMSTKFNKELNSPKRVTFEVCCGFCTQQCSCAYELTTCLTVHTSPAQDQADKNPNIKGEGQEVRPPDEGLLAIDGCWQRESRLSLRMSPPSQEATRVTVHGLTPMHILAALRNLCDLKKE